MSFEQLGPGRQGANNGNIFEIDRLPTDRIRIPEIGAWLFKRNFVTNLVLIYLGVKSFS
jgi:hypothetical protein